MKLTKNIALVGSGNNGLCISNGYDCNVYVVDTGDGLIMIDAGSAIDSEVIEREMEKCNYHAKDLRYIVITHAHADHVAGVPYFLEKSGAKVVSCQFEADVLSNKSLLDSTMDEYIKAGFYPAGYSFPTIATDIILSEGEVVSCGNVSMSAIIAPGHSGGCLCLYGDIDGSKTLFSGDVVFFNGMINLISIFDADLLKYKQSIFKLEKLDITTLLPGHLQPIMCRGNEHIKKAADAFRNFSVPRSIC